MPLRTTTLYLRERLRELVEDPAGANQVFSEQNLQDALDRYKVETRYLELTPVESRLPGGGLEFRLYVAAAGNWETAALFDWDYRPVAPAQPDLAEGRWEFVANQVRPVFLNGKTFDLAGAGADLLRRWAAKEKLNHDLSVSGKSLSESQKFRHLMELAAQLETDSRRWPGHSFPSLTDGDGHITYADFLR